MFRSWREARRPSRAIPHSPCWEPLFSPSQTFAGIGLPFPNSPDMRVNAPRKTRSGWRLGYVITSVGTTETLDIDGKSLRIRSLTLIRVDPATHARARIVEHASIPRSAKLPVPKPRC